MTPARLVQLLCEEEIKLIDNLFFTQDAKRMTVAFTAPERASGCSWLVARIAQRLATRVDNSVCTINTNLH